MSWARSFFKKGTFYLGSGADLPVASRLVGLGWVTGGVAVIDVVVLISAVAAFIMGAVLGRWEERRRRSELGRSAEFILEKARQDADAIKNRELLSAQQEILRNRQQVEQELNERRQELRDWEKRLTQREESLARKQEQLEYKEERLNDKEGVLSERVKALRLKEQTVDERLAQVAKMTADEAREELLAKVERENASVLADRIRRAEEAAREEADRRARRIISTAIQKWSADQVAEATVSVVNLPTDEMKGRIIGREGRNIRMLESITGVDLIIDDTPEAVILSGFDPVRREVARMALERLVADGRIHPARIEDVVDRCRKELDERIVEEGEKAALEAGVTGLHPELIKILGKLRFRTSYGQNVLYHSLEVSFLAAQMAAEIGGDIEVAKRAGLLHDIGKAVTGDVEGPHAIVGARLCRKFGESPEVVHCVEAHHEDVEQLTAEAMLLQAADTISAARPGARKENVETYIKRLEKLEVLAESFEGVEQTYAIQAGREIRVIVRPEVIDDLRASKLARDVAAKIEKELNYPGQIKVTVIREIRSCDYAR